MYTLLGFMIKSQGRELRNMDELVVRSKGDLDHLDGHVWLKHRSIECIEDMLSLHRANVLIYPAHFFIGDRNFCIYGPGRIYMEDRNGDFTIRVYFELGKQLLFN